MDLDEWMWRNKCSIREIAEGTGLSMQTIFNLKRKSKSPTLNTGVAVCIFTNNEVQIQDLIPEEDKKTILNVKTFERKNETTR